MFIEVLNVDIQRYNGIQSEWSNEMNGQMKWGATCGEVSIMWRNTHFIHFNNGEVEMSTKVTVVV